MSQVTKSISVSIAGVRMSISQEGLDAICDALDVGADGFGQGHGTEAGENEAWAVIDMFKQSRDALRGGEEVPLDTTALDRLEEPFRTEARVTLHKAGCSG